MQRATWLPVLYAHAPDIKITVTDVLGVRRSQPKHIMTLSAKTSVHCLQKLVFHAVLAVKLLPTHVCSGRCTTRGFYEVLAQSAESTSWQRSGTPAATALPTTTLPSHDPIQTSPAPANSIPASGSSVRFRIAAAHTSCNWRWHHLIVKSGRLPASGALSTYAPYQYPEAPKTCLFIWHHQRP
jgi:hypothetical protein